MVSLSICYIYDTFLMHSSYIHDRFIQSLNENDSNHYVKVMQTTLKHFHHLNLTQYIGNILCLVGLFTKTEFSFILPSKGVISLAKGLLRKPSIYMLLVIYYNNSPKKALRLINNRRDAFCSIIKIFFVSDRLDPNLNFDVSVLKIDQN